MRPPSPRLVACAGKHFDPVVVRALLAVPHRRLIWAMGPTAWLAGLPMVGQGSLGALRTAVSHAGTSALSASVVAVAAVAPTSLFGGASPAPQLAAAAQPAWLHRARPRPPAGLPCPPAWRAPRARTGGSDHDPHQAATSPRRPGPGRRRTARPSRATRPRRPGRPRRPAGQPTNPAHDSPRHDSRHAAWRDPDHDRHAERPPTTTPPVTTTAAPTHPPTVAPTTNPAGGDHDPGADHDSHPAPEPVRAAHDRRPDHQHEPLSDDGCADDRPTHDGSPGLLSDLRLDLEQLTAGHHHRDQHRHRDRDGLDGHLVVQDR